MDKKKKMIAAVIVAILIVGALVLLIRFSSNDKLEKAGLQDLLDSTSVRVENDNPIVTASDSGFYNIAATSAAVYYDSDGQKTSVPLLSEWEQEHTKQDNIKRFLEVYPVQEVVAVGDLDTPGLITSGEMPGRDMEAISISIAKLYWKSSDGAMIVKWDKGGYEQAVTAAPLASYVNIPIIVTNSMSANVESALEDLRVKYTITCGDIRGYKKVMSFDTLEEINDMSTLFIQHPEGLNSDVQYITLANPTDNYYPELVETTVPEGSPFTGSLFHIYAGGDSAYAGLEESKPGDDWEVNIPDDMNNVVMNIKISYKPHPQCEIDGERIYVFVNYYDPDLDGGYDTLYYFGTAGGFKSNDQEVAEFNVPVYGATGKYVLHVEGRNTYEAGSGGLLLKKEVPYTMSVALNEYENPMIPNMPQLSSLAPYLTAFRCGLVLAKTSYATNYNYLDNSTQCREPAVFSKGLYNVNQTAIAIHDDLTTQLGKLQGYEGDFTRDAEVLNDLADHYFENPIHVGIIADTNMVPWYYHKGATHGTVEGKYQPGDMIYSDINFNTEDGETDLGPGRIDPGLMDGDLPVGRIVGWDKEDVSSLVARTFFYYDILDNYVGHSKDDDKLWKNNAYAFLGSKVPVESMYGTLVDTIVEYSQNGGFTSVMHTSEVLSDIKLSGEYQEGSNYILGGVHGNYYWYVPACRVQSTAGGSAYDVSNVNEMSFGPSTMFLVSCITGRIDGMSPQSCLAMTYMHNGVNCYVGASRTTFGWIDPDLDFDMRFFEPEGAVLLGEMFTEELLIEDKDIGTALRDAKNKYLAEDVQSGSIQETQGHIIYWHYICYGDPAFNPYEPANA